MADQPSPDRIESSFRYGSTIIIGVLSGFSLAFMTAWAANPVPWDRIDIIAVAPMVAGVAFQLFSVWRLLDPRSLELAFYRNIIRLFMIGLVLVLIGSAAALGIDFITDTSTYRAPTSAAGH